MSGTELYAINNPCLDTNTSLGVDQACLSVINLYNTIATFYSIVAECKLCKGIPRSNLEPNSNTTFLIQTKYPLHIYYKTQQEWCHTTYNFKEYGSYGWNISATDICSDIYVIREPVNSYFPLFVVFMLFVGSAILCTAKVIIRLIKVRLSADNVQDDLDRLQETESATLPVIRTTKISTRIRSVDAFRGMTILLMIFVNNGGGKYVFFEHAAWYGLTVADLVLPWFAWIMGLTITISKRSELRVTTSRIKIIVRCLQRSLILILLGLMLNSVNNKPLSMLRFPGVLQLLAVSYFICASVETIFMKAHSQFGRFNVIRDILDSWPQWLLMIAIMVVHTLITFLLPVPNCPKGYLGPGGYDHFNKYANCTAGAAGYIDRTIFGDHMYSKTTHGVYGHIASYDPEGLMNTISAIFIVYLGVHAGKILLLYYQCNSRVIRWLFWAALTGIVAGILCNFEKEGGVIPVSKRMMTLSFVLTTSCFAFILFTILYLLIDYKQYWSGAPFIYAGVNPIFLYVGHILTKDLFPWSWKIIHPTHAKLLGMNLWVTTLWALIAFYLYRKDIVITI